MQNGKVIVMKDLIPNYALRGVAERWSHEMGRALVKPVATNFVADVIRRGRTRHAAAEFTSSVLAAAAVRMAAGRTEAV